VVVDAAVTDPTASMAEAPLTVVVEATAMPAMPDRVAAPGFKVVPTTVADPVVLMAVAPVTGVIVTGAPAIDAVAAPERAVAPGTAGTPATALDPAPVIAAAPLTVVTDAVKARS
jgi:hypothetical protein